MRLSNYNYRVTDNASRRRKALENAAASKGFDQVISTLQNKKYRVKDYKARRIQADINHLRDRKQTFSTGFDMDLDFQL